MSNKNRFILFFGILNLQFAPLFSNDLAEIKTCVGKPGSEQKKVDCPLSDGRVVSVFITSAERAGLSESLCIQKALSKARIFAGSYQNGHKVHSDYQRNRHLDSDSLSVSVSHQVESELNSKITGFFEVFRFIENENCFIGVSQGLSELKMGNSNKAELIVKGRPPFKDVILAFPQISSQEGAALIRLPDQSYLVVASGMAKGALGEAKSFRIAQTRAQLNLSRLFHQEKVFEYNYIETTMQMKTSPNGTITQVQPQQVFASFIGFSQKLEQLQPVHCHWYDLKKPDQRWALVGFHMSKNGEVVPHNQPWGL